jgi:glutathione S-transferase
VPQRTHKLNPAYKAAKEKKDAAEAAAAKDLRAVEDELKSVEPRVKDPAFIREHENEAADICSARYRGRPTVRTARS